MTKRFVVALLINLFFACLVAYAIMLITRSEEGALPLLLGAAGLAFILIAFLQKRFRLPAIIPGIFLSIAVTGTLFGGQLYFLRSLHFWLLSAPVILVNYFLFKKFLKDEPSPKPVALAAAAVIGGVLIFLGIKTPEIQKARYEKKAKENEEKYRAQIKALNDRYLAGEKDLACAVTGLAPDNGAFTECKKKLLALKTPLERWREFSKLKEEQITYWRWIPFQHDTPVVPKNEQRALLKLYLDTWFALTDEQIGEFANDFGHSLNEPSLREWEPEARKYVYEERGEAIVKRLAQARGKMDHEGKNNTAWAQQELERLVSTKGEIQ